METDLVQGGRFDWSGVGLGQAMTPWPALESAKGWTGGSCERVGPRVRDQTTTQGGAGELEGGGGCGRMRVWLVLSFAGMVVCWIWYRRRKGQGGGRGDCASQKSGA